MWHVFQIGRPRQKEMVDVTGCNVQVQRKTAMRCGVSFEHQKKQTFQPTRIPRPTCGNIAESGL